MTTRWSIAGGVGGVLLAAGLLSAGLVGGCASEQHPYFAASMNKQFHEEAMHDKQIAEQAEDEQNWDKAIDYNKQALRLEPDMGAAWNNLGQDLMKRGQAQDFVDAAQALKQAADLLPTDDRPYLNLGVLYHERGFSEEALRYFGLALERNPNRLESLRGAIASAKKLNKADDAGLARVNRALMMETDAHWRQIMEFERMRIQQELADRGKTATGA